MRKLALVLSAATLTISGAAVAQSSPAARAAQPDLTRAQVQERAAERFARMDANRDGKFDTADRAARQAAMFDRIDSDRNGSISRDEFSAMQSARGAKRTEMRGQRAERQAGNGRRAMLANGPITQAAFVERALARFDRADADRNGTVTQAERKAMRQQLRGAARQS